LEPNARIYVAGSATLVGSAILSRLREAGFGNVLDDLVGPDLTDPREVASFFADTRPEYVFLAAGRSGGIAANQRYPADLLRDNLLVACHVMHSANEEGVRKLLFLASSCSYPRLAPQPISEEALLTGPLEPTNEAYALGKIAGIKLCQAYRHQHGAGFVTAIPANVFGPGDDFSLEESHVIPALIRKMHEAKLRGSDVVHVWGSGAPQREFLYVDDLADACLFVMNRYDSAEPINIGCGAGVSIRDVAEAVRQTVGYRGTLSFDRSKPDGMPRKVLSSAKLHGLGWCPRISFHEALTQTYNWFLRCAVEERLIHA
jgi:GDP-L-fucose synthase